MLLWSAAFPVASSLLTTTVVVDTDTDPTTEFDKLVHQPTRLQVFASLYRHGETGFSDLVEELDLTEDTLASHLQRMEEAEAVAVHKEFVDRKPRTTDELTEEGRELFEDHSETLEALIGDLDG